MRIPQIFTLIQSVEGCAWRKEGTDKKRIRWKSFDNHLIHQSGRRGSNPRPSAWKANALSTELLPQSQWARMDSNHRRHKPADLQSAPFGHSGICPFAIEKSFSTVPFSIALQRYDFYFNLQIKSIIFIAVIAHSSPLLPNLPPARSSACCMVLVVIRP